ncbi:hypothetical protein ACQJBY_060843 [Aegilops geniculata]
MAPSGSNPLGPVFQTVAAFSRRLLIAPDTAPDDHRLRPLLSLSLSPPAPPPPAPPPPPEVLKKDAKVASLTKEEVGRATWMLLHTIATQFPDEPTRQQKRDAKELMALISRMYPCKECADHFKEVLKYQVIPDQGHIDITIEHDDSMAIYMYQLLICGAEQILCRQDPRLSSLSGYAMCTMWLIEALEKQYFPARE